MPRLYTYYLTKNNTILETFQFPYPTLEELTDLYKMPFSTICENEEHASTSREFFLDLINYQSEWAKKPNLLEVELLKYMKNYRIQKDKTNNTVCVYDKYGLIALSKKEAKKLGLDAKSSTKKILNLTAFKESKSKTWELDDILKFLENHAGFLMENYYIISDLLQNDEFVAYLDVRKYVKVYGNVDAYIDDGIKFTLTLMANAALEIKNEEYQRDWLAQEYPKHRWYTQSIFPDFNSVKEYYPLEKEIGQYESIDEMLEAHPSYKKLIGPK